MMGFPAHAIITNIWFVLPGHSSTIHACTVEDDSLVGMKATLLDGVTVRLQAQATCQTSVINVAKPLPA